MFFLPWKKNCLVPKTHNFPETFPSASHGQRRANFSEDVSC